MISRAIKVVLLFIFLAMTAGVDSVATAADPLQQDSPPSEDWLFQFELFQGLLEQTGLTPVSSVREVFNHPQQSVVILTGEITSKFPPRGMELFCATGGRLLIACDTGFTAGRIAEFQSGPVLVRGSKNRYEDFADCIVISDFPAEHPTTKGVRELVVNRSGWLTRPRWFQPQWQELAVLPTNVTPYSSRSKPILLDAKIWPSGPGRMLVAADHSIFTNGMLWHGDNALFAIQVAEWLAEGDRTSLLFISDGKALGGFLDSPALQAPSVPENLSLPEMDLATAIKFGTSLVNKTVQTSQKQNLMNEYLANRPRKMRSDVYRRWLLFAACAVVVLFAVWRFTCTHYNFFPAVPMRPMQSALELSQADLSRHHKLNQAAGRLARDFCFELTGSTDSRVWVQQLSEQSLNDRVINLSREERTRLKTIVDLATNNRTIVISDERLVEIGNQIQTFRRQHRDLPLSVKK